MFATLYWWKFFLIEFFGTPVYSGVRVEKLSGKPFKSGHKINTVKGLTYNPHSGELAYTFIDDESMVDCHQVYSIQDEIDLNNPWIHKNDMNIARDLFFRNVGLND